MIDHVALAGLRVVNRTPFAIRAGVVVVAGHEAFDYDELLTATQALHNGARLVGAGRDRTYPMSDGPWPATGALLAAVEYAAGVEAVTVGKPEPGLFQTALARLGPGRALMVGDRLDADLAGAHAAGIDGAIVLTGVATLVAARDADPSPAAIAPTLADLVLA